MQNIQNIVFHPSEFDFVEPLLPVILQPIGWTMAENRNMGLQQAGWQEQVKLKVIKLTLLGQLVNGLIQELCTGALTNEPNLITERVVVKHVHNPSDD